MLLPPRPRLPPALRSRATSASGAATLLAKVRRATQFGRAELLDRLLRRPPGITAAEIGRVQTAIEPANLSRAAAMGRLSPARWVLVPGVGVPNPELITVVAAELQRLGGHSKEDALKTLCLKLQATA